MLGSSTKHLRRYREIAGVLAKHGWGWMLAKIGMSEHLGRVELPKVERPGPVHLREALEELGPAFIKLGQLLSSRPDIVPEAYAMELSRLQDTATVVPVAEIRVAIESEFEVKVSDLYCDFDDIPLAAASIAQVHAATLSDGSSVIVKVQRPNIRGVVETDIEILYKRAKFLEDHWERARTYGVSDLVDEFALFMHEEMDFTREASNTDRLRESLAGSKGIRVPHVNWHLTTSRVLTLERMRGRKVTDVARNPYPGVNNTEVAHRLASVFLEQVFVNRFFHADPHPGNIFVTDQGEIELVDCGQVRAMDAATRAGAVRMLLAFEEENTQGFADEVLNLGIAGEDVDVRKFTRDIGRVLREFYDLPARSINMGALMMRVLNTSAAHKIRLPVVFAVLGKVFANVDAICRQLDPACNFTVIARDYVGRAIKGELKSETTIAEFYRALSGFRRLFVTMPEQVEKLLRKAVEGALRIEFKHQGLERLSDSFQSGANRVAMALIVGAVIVGSSLVIVSGAGPAGWMGLPAIGVFGYSVATIFGISVIVSIIRSGGKR